MMGGTGERWAFAAELLRLRLRAGLSGVALSRMAHTDASFLSRLERGRRETHNADLVDALGATPEEHDGLRTLAGLPVVSVQWCPVTRLVALTLQELPAEQRERFAAAVGMLAAGARG